MRYELADQERAEPVGVPGAKTFNASRVIVLRREWSDSNVRIPSQQTLLRMLESKDH